MMDLTLRAELWPIAVVFITGAFLAVFAGIAMIKEALNVPHKR